MNPGLWFKAVERYFGMFGILIGLVSEKYIGTYLADGPGSYPKAN